MDDALTVRRGERVEHSLPQPEHGSGAERAIRELLGERPALHILHGVVREPIGHACVVHRHDVGVGEPGEQLRFAHEPLDGILGRELGADDLDRHQAVEAEIAREHDDAHATCAERALRRSGHRARREDGRGTWAWGRLKLFAAACGGNLPG